MGIASWRLCKYSTSRLRESWLSQSEGAQKVQYRRLHADEAFRGVWMPRHGRQKQDRNDWWMAFEPSRKVVRLGGKSRGLFECLHDRSTDGHIDQPCFTKLHRTDMSTEQTHRRFPNIQFRVLVIGRANAGKTSILQQVCDTTESPTIYRWRKHGGREKVRGPNFVCESDLTADLGPGQTWPVNGCQW